MLYSFTVGKVLKSTREKKDLRLIDVASRVGLSVQYICDVESGRRAFPADKVEPWAIALGMPVDVLIGYLLSEAVDHLERKLGRKVPYRVLPASLANL
jgi:transcriptional regulator with XRE-family HTH domain